jgi:hypothetical protein
MSKKSSKRFLIIILFLMLLQSHFLLAQIRIEWTPGECDTNYISDHSPQLTTRFYASTRNTTLSLYDGDVKQTLRYLPNEDLILGAGFSYKFLTINVGFNFPGLNNDNERFGKTNFFGLQTHLYGRKSVIDLYGQHYKGFYLSNPHDFIPEWPEDKYPKRRDIESFSFGIHFMHVFNDKRFSYRASFDQTDWQKKCAGSFLLGGEVYYIITDADSSIIPFELTDPTFFDGVKYQQSNVFTIGPSGGYAYTVVLWKHIFLTLSLVGGVSFGHTAFYESPDKDKKIENFTFNYGVTGRWAFGYNSRSFYIGLSNSILFIRNQTPIDQAWLDFQTGILNFNIAKRFKIKTPVRIFGITF